MKSSLKNHLKKMKKLFDFLAILIILFFIFYGVFYIIMDFPHPEWAEEQAREIKTQLN